MCLGLEEQQQQGSLGVGCSELLPSIPRVAAAAPECSLLPGALPWLGRADLKRSSLGFSLWRAARVPACVCLGGGRCSSGIPGAAASGCDSTKVSGGLSQPGQVCQWSSSECLIFLSAVSMQVSPGSLEQGEAVPRLGWGVPGRAEQGAGCCSLSAGTEAPAGLWGVPSAVPPSPHPSGNPHPRPCTAPWSVGSTRSTPTQQPPGF